MLPKLHGPLSLPDYLPSEIASAFRREYVGGFWYGLHGETYEEDGTSVAHARLLGHVVAELYHRSEERGLWLATSQFKLHIPEQQSFFYPDAAVYLSEQVEEWYGTQPLLLLEITDQRSNFIDHTLKYAAYTAIPSLQTYLIADQYERRVYAYQRVGASWKLTEYVGSGMISLPYLGMELSLDAIYDGVLG